MSKYDTWKAVELREELKRRKAKAYGKKKDLIERLEAYDRNANFADQPLISEVWSMSLPAPNHYRDVTGNTMLPPISPVTVQEYLMPFGTALDKHPRKLYNDRFVKFIRIAEDKGVVYLKSACRAEMFKRTTYEVDLKLDKYGNIEEAQCECTAGAGPACHCKHMKAVLLALLDQKEDRPMLLELTCTEQLQSFHRPKKMHKGSPVKSADLGIADTNTFIFDPIPVEFRETDEEVRTRVRNATINFAASTGIRPPMLQTIPPANVYGAVFDHDYMKLQLTDKVLLDDSISAIDLMEIDDIEASTRGQSADTTWFDERIKRLTSSNFGRICKLTNKTNMKVYSRSLMTIRKISSRSLAHGRRYEPVAVAKFEKETGLSVQQSGLVVSADRPYLACSPDGLIGDDTILEVKCPSASKNKLISSVTVPYLKTGHDGNFYLHGTHDYMYQVQGCMHITGRSKCKFVVFTLTDMTILDISYDAEFVKSMLSKLSAFFHQHFKQEYLNKCIFKDSNLYCE